ncbi:MAG: ATP synthase subunit I, partial [Thiohalorhabdus sp.]
MSVGWVGLALALAGGMGLGGLYFAGLWWTVRRLPETGHPALVTLASLATRLGGLLAGLWLLT